MQKTARAKTSKETSGPIKKKPASISADLLAANHRLRREIADRKLAEQQLQRQNDLLSGLYQGLFDLLQYRDLNSLLQVIIARAAELLDAPYGEIMLIEGDELVVHAFTPNQPFLAGDRLRESKTSLSWQAVTTRQPAVLDDYSTWPHRRAIYSRRKLHAVAEFPILSGDRCLGVFGMGRGRRGYVFDAAQVQAGRLFAQLVALAIDNTQLYAHALVELEERKQAEEALQRDKQKYEVLFNAAQRQTQELWLLNEVRTELARETDLADLMRSVVEAIAKTFGYSQVSLYMLRDGQLHLQHQVGYEHIITEIPVTRGIVGRTARSGVPVFLPDVRADPEFVGAIEGIVSEICVPLFDQQHIAGVLNVESTQGVKLSEADLRLITALGEHIDIAINRTRLYEALRHSERRYKELVNYAGDIIYKTDPAGHFTFINPIGLRITGFNEAELIGADYRNFIRPDYRQRAKQFYLKQWRDKTPSTYFEFPCVTKDGSLVWLGQNVRLIFDVASDRILETQAIARDITELKRIEAALRQHAVELSERNAELDTFAHTVAHDLKGLVGTMVGFSEVLLDQRDTLPPDKIDQLLHLIDRNGRKINNIIDELLLLSGVRQQAIVPEPIEMGSIIDEAIQRLSDSIQESKAEIVLPDRSIWPTALGYAPWIEEVWANYLSNAIKYGGQPPHVEVGVTLRPSGSVRFWVRDNGYGLSPEERSRLFTPFTRLNRVRAKGQGLGLSIVRHIIEKLGGSVGVESEVGQGSTFYFTLPMVSARR